MQLERESSGPNTAAGIGQSFAHLWADQHGATLVEYGVILMAIAAVCVAAVALIGQAALGFFQSVPAGL